MAGQVATRILRGKDHPHRKLSAHKSTSSTLTLYTLITAHRLLHFLAGKIHVRNTIEQLKLVGPRSMGVSLLTAGFVGMVFTIQVLPPALHCSDLHKINLN